MHFLHSTFAYLTRMKQKAMILRTVLVLLCVFAIVSPTSAGGFEPGRAAPNCSLMPLGNAEGYEQPFDLARFRGKVVYLDFWASWCAPCVQSFPFMNNLDRAFRERGLQILGINLDQKRDDAMRFLAKHAANFTVAFDAGGGCPQDFAVQGMPASYVIDRNGIVRYVHVGFRRGEAEAIRAVIERLLNEDPAEQRP